MVALGLLLVILSGATTLAIVLNNTDPTSASAFGLTLSNVTIGGLFLAGAVVGLVFMLGLATMVAGASRRRARRLQTRRTVKDVRTEKEQLEEENARLKAQLTEPYPTEGSRSPDTDYVPSSWNDGDRTATAATSTTTGAGGRHERKGMFRR